MPHPDDEQVEALLRRLDHLPPRVDVETVIRRARERRAWTLRPAAAIALLAGVAAVAYAVPHSPVRAWLRELVTRGPTSAPPQRPEATPPAAAGIAVEPGASLLIVFRSLGATGEVRVRLSDSAEVLVQAPAGAATFTSDQGRLLIEAAGSPAGFDLRIPRSAPRIEVRVDDLRLLWKEGPRVSVRRPHPDGPSGRCVGTEDSVISERLRRVAGVVVVLSLAGCR